MKLLLLLILLFSVTLVNAQNQPIDAKQLEKKKDIYYLKGVPYTGACFENFPNGKKGKEGVFKNGLEDDIWIWYYENGNKKRETNYRNGKMHGLSVIWYKNGQKRSEIIYDMDQNVKQYRWDEEGNFLPPPQFGN